MADRAYRLSLTPSARRAPTETLPAGLPLAVAMAVGEFITGPLLERPQIVGKPLNRDLAGYTRRAAARIGSSTASTSRLTPCT